MNKTRLVSHAVVLLLLAFLIASCAPGPPAVAVSQMRALPPVATETAVPSPEPQPAAIATAALTAPPVPSPAASPATSPIASPSPVASASPVASTPPVASPWPVGPAAKPGEPVLEPGGVVLPSVIPTGRPLQVIVAFHGAGGTGPRTAERMADCAERAGVAIVAPSMAYRDFMDPEQVRLDDQQNLPKVLALLNSLQSKIGVPLDTTRVQVYGFSRGGQMAHRFALFYPDRVSGVAALSAGNYTIPKREAQVSGVTKPLAFPYGVSDLQKYTGHAFDGAALRKVPFWIGIGGTDNSPDHVPHAWDSYIGNNRLERARRFVDYLTGMGVPASLEVFSGIGHEDSVAMRTRACDFLRQQTRPAA